MKHSNPDHSKEFNRISRIQGQLDGIKRMIEENRYCPDILSQTKAIASAVRSLEASILEKHLEHCVYDAIHSGKSKDSKKKIAELMDIFSKRLP